MAKCLGLKTYKMKQVSCTRALCLFASSLPNCDSLESLLPDMIEPWNSFLLSSMFLGVRLGGDLDILSQYQAKK